MLCHKSPSETKTASKLGEMEGIRSCQMMEETQSHENMNIFPLPEERKKRNMFTANLFVLGRDVLSFLVVTSKYSVSVPLAHIQPLLWLTHYKQRQGIARL